MASCQNLSSLKSPRCQIRSWPNPAESRCCRVESHRTGSDDCSVPPLTTDDSASCDSTFNDGRFCYRTCSSLALGTCFSLMSKSSWSKPSLKAYQAIEEVRIRMNQYGFDEELIEQVRCRPAIWDTRCKNYKTRAAHDHEWMQIGMKLQCPKEICKGRWRSLRDIYMKELKKKRSKWVRFEQLSFLKDIATVSQPRANEEPPEESAVDPLRADSPEIVEIMWSDTNPETAEDVTSSEPKMKRYRSPSPSPESTRQSAPDSPRQSMSMRYLDEAAIVVRPEAEDEDTLFAKSLVPYLKLLPPVQKLRLRSRIENLIADEISEHSLSTV